MAEGGREASGETRQVEDGEMSNTVAVSGFSANTSQELLELYFENSRRSGGGDIEEVQIRDGVAYITFKDADVAQRVVSHNHHQVDGQTLTVTLFHPSPPKPCYQNRVLIQGLNNAVTEKLLTNVLETATEAKVREFLYGEEEGKVVVTFSNNIDIGQLRKTLQERSIKGTFLKVARVGISNCILVQNIQTSTSHDIVLFYFDNKRRSGGGHVERVEMKADEGYCLVYFEDHSVIDRVVSQSHKVDGGDLEVHLHYECLGRRSSVNKPDPYLRISSPVNKDEDSSSVSSNPDIGSDFLEVQEMQESKVQFPLCGMVLEIFTGNQPEGTMKITKSTRSLPGYEECGLIEIFYEFHDGIQRKDHPHPGKPYRGTRRKAYLPDNREGQKVSNMLKVAFDRKLVFTIGESRTTGKADTVTWNDIHHKTRTEGGPSNFGYPDPDYLRRVKEELEANGVTEADI